MKSLTTCMLIVIAIAIASNVAFGDILTDGDDWPRTSGA